MTRKLIEVALPLEAINRESAREKSIRHGHPSTLHLWWARRPLAACRAILFAQLVDDPSCDLARFPTLEEQALERRRLFDIVERLASWEQLDSDGLLRVAHAEIAKCYAGDLPAILDPFAGGGSIPLEAQRLGMEAVASDLNPVAVLINRVLLEAVPRWLGRPPVHPGAEARLGAWSGASGFAEDVRLYGEWMLEQARLRLRDLYPDVKLPDGSRAPVISWIWARTVACPNPACGIEMPLVRSWWLGKKKGKEAYVVPWVEDGVVHFVIGRDLAKAPAKEIDGTVTRTGAVCIGCRTGVPLSYVREEGRAKRLGVRLMAIAAEGYRQRIYVAPTEEHERAASLPPPGNAPDSELPEAALGFRVQSYGMRRHSDLFTSRQLTALVTLSGLVQEARRLAEEHSRAAGLAAPDAEAYARDLAPVFQ